jgi:hypothetical protein
MLVAKLNRRRSGKSHSSLILCFQDLAQEAAPPPAPQFQPLSSEQLDQLLGPIALYPDRLIAEILLAATLPVEVAMADRYVSGGDDPNLIDQQPWDPSVQALARYPTVLKWMANLAGAPGTTIVCAIA